MPKDRRTKPTHLTDEDLIYNESCVVSLLNISLSMELFYTMLTIFYLNWDSCGRGDWTEEKKRVIMLGTPLLYKKHFVNGQ